MYKVTVFIWCSYSVQTIEGFPLGGSCLRSRLMRGQVWNSFPFVATSSTALRSATSGSFGCSACHLYCGSPSVVIPLALNYATGIVLSRAHPTPWGITPQVQGFRKSVQTCNSPCKTPSILSAPGAKVKPFPAKKANPSRAGGVELLFKGTQRSQATTTRRLGSLPVE